MPVKIKSGSLKEYGIIVVIAVFAAMFYAHTLDFGFVWDDVRWVTKNPCVKNACYIPAYFITDIWRLSSDPMRSTYYRPLYLMSIFLDYAAGGLNAKTFHFTNILLFTLLSLLIYALTKQISGSRKVSVFTAALFAVHPVTAQAVSWISARADLLFLVFILSSFILFIKAIPPARSYERILFYLGSVLMFALGLLSKETALFLLPLLIWYDYCFISDFNPRRLSKNIKNYIPYAAVIFFYVWVKHAISENMGWVYMKNPLSSPLGKLLALTAKSIPYYVKSAMFSFEGESQAFKIPVVPAPDLAGIASVVILTGFLIYYFYRYGSSFRKEIFFLGWAAIASLHILFIATIMGSRFLLFPIIGITGFISLFFIRLTDTKQALRRAAFYIIFSAAVIACAVLSHKITLDWKNDGSLLKVILAKYPDDPEARENLGYWYSDSNDLKAAIREYERALSLNPRLTRARFNLAHAYYALGKSDEAVLEFKKLAKLDDSMPRVHQALAVIYEQKGRYKEAIEEVKDELSINPSDSFGMLEFLALLYQKNGEIKKSDKIRMKMP